MQYAFQQFAYLFAIKSTDFDEWQVQLSVFRIVHDARSALDARTLYENNFCLILNFFNYNDSIILSRLKKRLVPAPLLILGSETTIACSFSLNVDLNFSKFVLTITNIQPKLWKHQCCFEILSEVSRREFHWCSKCRVGLLHTKKKTKTCRHTRSYNKLCCNQSNVFNLSPLDGSLTTCVVFLANTQAEEAIIVSMILGQAYKMKALVPQKPQKRTI